MLETVNDYKIKRFFNFRPFVFFALATVLGVVCSILSVNFGVIIIYLPLALFCVIGVIFAFLSDNKYSVYAFVMATLFICVALVCSIKIANIKKYENFFEFDEQVIVGKVVSIRSYNDEYAYILDKVTFSDEKIDCNAVVYSSQKFAKGDLVKFKGCLKPIEKSKYSSFLAENIGFIADASANIEYLGADLNIFDKCFVKIRSVITENMGEQAPFSLALITGDSSLIDKNELNNFRLSGVSHIFAVSGLHIGFLVGLLNAFCELLKIKRVRKVIIIAIISLLYSGICGFTPSSIRATIMSVIYLLTNAKGRKYDVLNSISLSLIMVLFINPFDILTVGFVLSYACVFSIALYYKTFENGLRLYPKKLNDLASISLAVQFGVAPIVCYYFGYTSIVSILINMLIVPIISLLFPILLIFTLISAIFPALSFLLKILEVILFAIRKLASFVEFGRLNLFIEFNVPMLFLYYFVSIFASDRINVSKNIKLGAIVLSSTLILLFAI